MKGYTAQAGLGPWSQVSDEGRRLQLLGLLGRSAEVLDEVGRLREQMASLPERDGDRSVEPWNVRELILDTGNTAALDLGLWEEALTLNAEVAQTKEGRGAPLHEVASTRFGDYFPLLRLGRVEEDRDMLRWCRGIFEAEHDRRLLGKVFSALADVEGELGHRAQAIGLEERALGYKYAAGDVDGVTVSHFNLAGYLSWAGHGPSALAHRLGRCRHPLPDGLGPSRPHRSRPGR